MTYDVRKTYLNKTYSNSNSRSNQRYKYWNKLNRHKFIYKYWSTSPPTIRNGRVYEYIERVESTSLNWLKFMEIVSKLPKWPNMLKFTQMTSFRRLPNTKSQKFAHSLQVMGKNEPMCVYFWYIKSISKWLNSAK